MFEQSGLEDVSSVKPKRQGSDSVSTPRAREYTSDINSSVTNNSENAYAETGSEKTTASRRQSEPQNRSADVRVKDRSRSVTFPYGMEWDHGASKLDRSPTPYWCRSPQLSKDESVDLLEQDE